MRRLLVDWRFFAAVAILGFVLAVLAITVNVRSNTRALNELQYQSCIEDAVLDFKIAEGDVLVRVIQRMAFDAELVSYSKSLEAMRQSQAICRTKFPK